MKEARKGDFTHLQDMLASEGQPAILDLPSQSLNKIRRAFPQLKTTCGQKHENSQLLRSDHLRSDT